MCVYVCMYAFNPEISLHLSNGYIKVKQDSEILRNLENDDDNDYHHHQLNESMPHITKPWLKLNRLKSPFYLMI